MSERAGGTSAELEALLHRMWSKRFEPAGFSYAEFKGAMDLPSTKVYFVAKRKRGDSRDVAGELRLSVQDADVCRRLHDHLGVGNHREVMLSRRVTRAMDTRDARSAISRALATGPTT